MRDFKLHNCGDYDYAVRVTHLTAHQEVSSGQQHPRQDFCLAHVQTFEVSNCAFRNKGKEHVPSSSVS